MSGGGIKQRPRKNKGSQAAPARNVERGNLNVEHVNLQISEEVSAALRENRPVVALETTIVSHGMPYPQNVQTAAQVDRIIRENGAVPASIGAIDGQFIIGMTAEQLDHMGKNGASIPKVSRRDIAAVCIKKLDGATTSAATSFLAARAGIRVFCTGGVGGVHRGAQRTMDISADLEELAQTPVMVVCAGAKAILDLGLTLEYLETKGVPVIGYKTKKLPAFYTSESDFEVDYRMDTPEEIADTFRAQLDMGLPMGMLVCNPIPREYEVPASAINPVIEQAVREAEARGIHGKDSTPFLLAKVKDITGGKSLEANIQLVYNNARLAARIAAALCR